MAECCSACSAYPACTVSVLVGKRCYLKNSSLRLSASSHHLACRPQAGKTRPDHSERNHAQARLQPASCSIYGCGGTFIPSRGCQCNPGCKAHGNCCYDHTEQCSSSAGKEKGDSNISIYLNLVRCADYGCSHYRRGNPCQCDAKCGEYDNCCHDYKATCLIDGGNYSFDDADDAGKISAAQGTSSKTILKTSSDDAGKKSATQGSPSKAVLKTSSDGAGQSSATQGSPSKTVLKTLSDGADKSSATQGSSSKTDLKISYEGTPLTTTDMKMANFTGASMTTPAETTGKVTSATSEAHEPSTTSQTDSRHTSYLKSACQKVAGRFLLNCSGVEKGNKGSHGRNTGIVVWKKFLQTAPRLDKGCKAFHSAPHVIALLAAVAAFTTFVACTRVQLCRTRQQADAEAEQFLEPRCNISEQQSGGMHTESKN